MNPTESDRPTGAEPPPRPGAPPKRRRRLLLTAVLATACFGLAMLDAPLRQLVFGPKYGGRALATWQQHHRRLVRDNPLADPAVRRTASPVEAFLDAYLPFQPTDTEWSLLPAADRRAILLSLANDPDEAMRDHAAFWLGSVPSNPEVVACLKRSLRETSWRVRRCAAISLGDLIPPATDSIPDLVGSLDDPNPIVGEIAASALGTIGASDPEDIAPIVSRLLKSPDAMKRREALDAICDMRAAGRCVAPAAQKALTDPDSHIRADAALALKCIAAKETVPALVRALSDPDRCVRDEAANAIGAIGPDARAAIPTLLEQVQALGGDETVAKAAPPQLEAIERMGDDAQEYIPELLELRQHKSATVRHWVEWALWSVDPGRFPCPKVGPDGLPLRAL